MHSSADPSLHLRHWRHAGLCRNNRRVKRRLAAIDVKQVVRLARDEQRRRAQVLRHQRRVPALSHAAGLAVAIRMRLQRGDMRTRIGYSVPSWSGANPSGHEIERR